MATTWKDRNGNPMTDRLSRQHLIDRLDAADAEREAVEWERSMRTTGGHPRQKWVSQRTLRMCGRSTMYCPHKPACPPTGQR